MPRRSGPASTVPTGRQEPTRSEPATAVLLVVPRFSRDGGVGAHVTASAAALAQDGAEVTVLCARNEETAVDGVEVIESPSLFDVTKEPAERIAGAIHRTPAVVHLHEVEEPRLLSWLGQHAPVVVSAHGFTACTSG